jgi:hypothetical protein
MQPHPGTGIFFAAVILGLVVLLNQVTSVPMSIHYDPPIPAISPGVHDAEDLVFERTALRDTIVTVTARISCLSETVCVLNLRSPLDNMVGIGLSALSPPDRKRIVLAGPTATFKITGFFDGVQLDVEQIHHGLDS